jgi:hypothetical protein
MSLKSSLTRTIARQKLTLSKNSPHILFVAGIGGVIAGTVLACRATLKTEKLLDEIKSEIDEVKSAEMEPRDVAYVYGKSAGRLLKVYGPAIAVTGVSITALTASHMQLSRRNTALTVAYGALHTAFMEYRSRVRDHLGEEQEKDLYHGVTLEQVKDEKGKLSPVKVVNPNGLSPYAVCFDAHSPNWYPTAEYNRLFLQGQQNYYNNILIARGHVFLNEVYDALGIERTKAGAVVGWVLNSDGDNYVDFNIFEAHNSGFVNGVEPVIWLDFNVDGVIYDKI